MPRPADNSHCAQIRKPSPQSTDIGIAYAVDAMALTARGKM